MKNKSKIDWKRGDTAVIRENWEDAGAVVQVLGPAIFLKQWWVPIKDLEEDPTFCKEAALSKSEELPDNYIPVSLCSSGKEKLPRETVYGIGQLKETQDEIGMWDGPNPDVYSMLDTPGRDSNSVIIEFRADGNESMLYRWHSRGSCWRKALDKEFYMEEE